MSSSKRTVYEIEFAVAVSCYRSPAYYAHLGGLDVSGFCKQAVLPTVEQIFVALMRINQYDLFYYR